MLLGGDTKTLLAFSKSELAIVEDERVLVDLTHVIIEDVTGVKVT